MRLLSAVLMLVLAGCQATDDTPPAAVVSDTSPPLALASDSQLDALLAQYAPYEMFYDASALAPRDKALLKTMVAASKLIDEAYLLQTSRAGIAMRAQLEQMPGPAAAKARTLLRRNAMPWDQLQNHMTFAGDQPFYPGHEIYPRGMTAQDFDAHYATLDPTEQAQFMSPYTVIRKDPERGYRAVPYHVEYREQTDQIAALLRDAAELTANESLQNYLRLKAAALQSDDYFAADSAWVDLTGNAYELVIGPFETYSDGIKGVKAKYESFV
ncbi:MAG: hypothetical protein KJO35_00825, partial [Gammaproteobacteria bacterium]|nr:hypothetical protein [Gammaproteobacteria bacterium]